MKANDYLDDKKPSASSFLDSDQPTGFKTKSLAELLSTYGEPNTLNAGAKVVSGLPGVLEVGARRGYAGLGKVEQGALSILGDLLGSDTLNSAADVVGNRARQIENSAVLRGQNQVGFAPESIVNDVPEAGANAVSSVIQTAPSLLAGALVPGASLPALFGQTFNQEYAQGKDSGLSPLKAAGRAVPMAAFEVAGEKLGGFDRLAEGLRAATRGNGVADLGSAMVSSALKEIPSEEFTTTGQFLTDKAPVIGLNQDATLADYAQQVKDTALTTALQSGAMGAAGRIVQGRNLQAPSVMDNIQPEVQQPPLNTPSIVDAINQSINNVKPSAAAFLDAEQPPVNEAINIADLLKDDNVSQPTQQPPAGLDSRAVESQPDNTIGIPAIELPGPVANAGSNSTVPNGALPASDIPDGVAPAEPSASVSEPSSNPLQLPPDSVVNDSLTTEQPSNPRQLPKKSKPKANTLLSAIDGLGGIDNKYKWDISGEQKFARGGYNKIFRNASTKTLEQHIENGDLDEFLPYDMRSTVTNDPTAGRDYLADRIRNGDRVLPYDVELEAKQSKVYESDPLQADIESAITDDTLDLDTVNALLSEAGYEEREQQNQSRYVETEPANTSGASQIENTQPGSAAVGIAGDQGRQAGQTARVQPAAQNEVTGTPRSNEREGTRQQVEAIVRRRAAANQLGKLKPFDNALKLAKDFMAGEPVSPAKFKNAATMFANDKPLADAFTALQELAKSPAKESRQNTRSAVDIFTEQINNAKTVDELRNIARNIQMETGVLNDAMAQQLDDMVMERIDAIENSGDLLGDNTEKQQAVADAERAKDEKRNAGNDNASDFVLTGLDRPADQAAARGAQDLFNQKNTESGYEYSKPESIDTPFQGQLNEARKNKESVSKQLKQLRRNYKDAPLGSGRNSLKLDIIRAESKLNEYKNLETDTLNSIEKRANELGKTTIKNKPDSAFKRDPMLDAIANIKRQQNQVVDQVQAYVDAIAEGWKNAPKIQVVYDMNDERIPEAVRRENDRQLSQGATGQPQGFITRGNVYIVASEMSGENDVLRTLFHESLGHYGLRGLYDRPALNAALDRVATMRAADVAKKAKQYGLDINNARDRLLAAEEVLAEMAETKPEIGVVKQVIAAIRAWLRDNIPYFKNLELSDAEIIRDYILPARRYVENGGKENGAKEVVAAFQRSIEPAPEKRSIIRDELGRQSPLNQEWETLEESGKLKNLQRALQDKYVDLKDVTKAIKATGRDIADSLNAYMQEELYHGRVTKRIQDFTKNELEPMINRMQELGVSIPEFEMYLWARHAPERNAQIAKINPDNPSLQDGGSGLTTKEANDYIAKIPSGIKRKLDEVAGMVDAINKRSRTILASYGIEDMDAVANMEYTYKHYVPLMRDLGGNIEGSGNGTGSGFNVKGNSTKRAMGSTKPVVDILANIASQREKFIVRGEKNRVATALIGLAITNPKEGFWSVDTPPKLRYISKETGFVEETTDPNYKNRDNVVVARLLNKQGKVVERALIFEESNERAMRLAASIKNLDVDSLQDVLMSLGSITRYFASINTQFNPVFGIVNIVRDVQGAMINLQSTQLAGKQKEVLANTWNAMSGIWRDLRAERNGEKATSEYSRLWQEYQQEGGQTGYRELFAKPSDRTKALNKAIDPDWWKKTKFGKVISFQNDYIAKAEAFVAEQANKWIFENLSDYNQTLENAVRLGAYKAALDAGMSKQQAASLGKNLTVNFNRKGYYGGLIGSLYAFFNASAQGTARIAETIYKDGKLTRTGKIVIQGGLLLGVMQAILLAGFGEDDPPEFERDRNLIMPIGGGKYIKLAMPLGYHIIPSTARKLTEFAMGNHKTTAELIASLAELYADGLNPFGGGSLAQVLTPTAFDPMISLYGNEDGLGRRIYQEKYNQNDTTAGYLRARDTANALSKSVAYGINILTGGSDYTEGVISPTPDQISFLAGQVGGGVAREVLKAGDVYSSLADGTDLPPYKIPLLGRFYGDAKSKSSHSHEFYSNMERMDRHKREIKGRIEDGISTEDYIEKHPEAGLWRRAQAVSTQIKNLRNRRDDMLNNNRPKNEIKNIEIQIEEMQKRFNKMVKEKIDT